jgi:hypothetical protein
MWHKSGSIFEFHKIVAVRFMAFALCHHFLGAK